MSNLDQETKPSQIILFRSKLTDQAGEDYQAMNAELETLVRQNPGFVDVKSYQAADGERLTKCGGGTKLHWPSGATLCAIGKHKVLAAKNGMNTTR